MTRVEFSTAHNTYTTHTAINFLTLFFKYNTHTGVYSLFWAGDFGYDKPKKCFAGKNLTKKMAQPLFRFPCAYFEP